MQDFGGFLPICINNRTCKRQPIRNEENNSQPIGTRSFNMVERTNFYLERRMLNLERAEPITVHIHDKTCKFECFWYKVSKNFKSLNEPIETVNKLKSASA